MPTPEGAFNKNIYLFLTVYLGTKCQMGVEIAVLKKFFYYLDGKQKSKSNFKLTTIYDFIGKSYTEGIEYWKNCPKSVFHQQVVFVFTTKYFSFNRSRLESINYVLKTQI